MNKCKNKFPIIAGILYLCTVITAVSFSWISGLYRYDFSLSFSIYVGMHYITSVLYFVSALIMFPLLTVFIVTTKMPTVKRIVYVVVFLCIFGTSLFPCNAYSNHPSKITTNLHNYIAIGLMLAVTASFILSAIFSRHKGQRIVAISSLTYAVAFVILFFTRFSPLFQTFFIWENLFIILLLLELHMEQYGEIIDKTKNEGDLYEN